jgi:cell division topological specificity factor
MLENFTAKFKKMSKKDQADKSKDAAKERLHLVLMQDRAHVSADFLDMMKQEIVDVIKKYIDVDENEMDVKLENKVNEDGTSGAPSLYANIPIVSINEEKKKESQELAKTKQAEEAKKTPIEEKAREIMAKKKKAAEKMSAEKKAELRNAKIEAKKTAEKAKAEAKTVAKQKKEEKSTTTEKKQAQKATKKETK